MPFNSWSMFKISSGDKGSRPPPKPRLLKRNKETRVLPPMPERTLRDPPQTQPKQVPWLRNCWSRGPQRHTTPNRTSSNPDRNVTSCRTNFSTFVVANVVYFYVCATCIKNRIFYYSSMYTEYILNTRTATSQVAKTKEFYCYVIHIASLWFYMSYIVWMLVWPISSIEPNTIDITNTNFRANCQHTTHNGPKVQGFHKSPSTTIEDPTSPKGLLPVNLLGWFGHVISFL